MKPQPGLAHLLLGQPEISERLMRGLALKGALPQYLGQEFEPNVLVEDLTAAEYDYLRRFNRYQAGAQVPAVAAQFGQAVFGRLAPGSRSALAVVDRIMISNLSAAACAYWVGFLQNGAGLGPGAGNELPTDDRVNQLLTVVGTRTLFTSGFGSNAADFHTAGHMPIQLGVNQTIWLDPRYILTGVADAGAVNPRILFIGCATANSSFGFGFFWKERALLTSEQ